VRFSALRVHRHTIASLPHPLGQSSCNPLFPSTVEWLPSPIPGRRGLAPAAHLVLCLHLPPPPICFFAFAASAAAAVVLSPGCLGWGGVGGSAQVCTNRIVVGTANRHVCIYDVRNLAEPEQVSCAETYDAQLMCLNTHWLVYAYDARQAWGKACNLAEPGPFVRPCASGDAFLKACPAFRWAMAPRWSGRRRRESLGDVTPEAT
jgi:hypothetical protein